MSIYTRLRDSWAKNRLRINVAARADEVVQFELNYELTLPETFKAYLLTINGMGPGENDANLIYFLPVDSIARESNLTTLGNEVEFIFAEWLTWSHWYILRATRRGEELGVFAYDGCHRRMIAGTFECFIETYLTQPSKIEDCWRT